MKLHVVGEAMNDDFRFISLRLELRELAKLYERAADAIAQISPQDQGAFLTAFLTELNEALQSLYDRLCEKTWVMDETTLGRPAGGSTKDWSASMNDGYAMLPGGARFRERA